MEKIQGERSSIVRASIRAGVVLGGAKYASLFNQYMVEEKVPNNNRQSANQYTGDLVKASSGSAALASTDPKADEAVQPEVKAPNNGTAKPTETKPSDNDYNDELMKELLSAIEEEDDSGFDLDADDNSGGTPLSQELRKQLDALLVKKDVNFLFKPFNFEGQSFYVVSTWRIRTPGFLWNLTGTTGNNPVLHRCGPEVLHFENESAVCVNEDIELNWTIDKGFSKSLLAGQTVKVDATVFLWLVRLVPGREYRFWLNEERDRPPKGRKGKEDIWTRRKELKG